MSARQPALSRELAARASRHTDGRLRLAVVFNPTKRRQRLDEYLHAVRERYGADEVTVSLLVSQSPADLPILARRAVDDGCDVLVAAGGDGTTFGVLNGIHEADVIFSVVPLGTSNDFAAPLGLPDVASAAAALADGVVRRVDLGRCEFLDAGGRTSQAFFCSSAGVGFAAALFRSEFSPWMRAAKRYLGDLAWVLASVQLGFTFRGCEADLELDQTRVRSSVWFFEVNKVQSVGGMRLTPLASLDNGCLDACLARDVSILRRARLLLALQLGQSHIGWPDIEYFTSDRIHNRYGVEGVQRIAVRPSAALPVHLNGDFVGYTPATFDVVPGGLAVMARPSAAVIP